MLRNRNQSMISTSNGLAATKSSQSLLPSVKRYKKANIIAASDHSISEQVIAFVTLFPHIAEKTVSTTEETNAAQTKLKNSYLTPGI